MHKHLWCLETPRIIDPPGHLFGPNSALGKTIFIISYEVRHYFSDGGCKKICGEIFSSKYICRKEEGYQSTLK